MTPQVSDVGCPGGWGELEFGAGARGMALTRQQSNSMGFPQYSTLVVWYKHVESLRFSTRGSCLRFLYCRATGLLEFQIPFLPPGPQDRHPLSTDIIPGRGDGAHQLRSLSSHLAD